MTYAVNAAPPFYHGTRADLPMGAPLAPGFKSNYREQKRRHSSKPSTPGRGPVQPGRLRASGSRGDTSSRASGPPLPGRASVLSQKSACIRARLRPARFVARRLHRVHYARSSRLAIGPHSRPRCDGVFLTQDTSLERSSVISYQSSGSDRRKISFSHQASVEQGVISRQSSGIRGAAQAAKRKTGRNRRG